MSIFHPCPYCGIPVITSYSYCPHCGINLKIFLTCKKCGALSPVGNSVCTECGGLTIEPITPTHE